MAAGLEHGSQVLDTRAISAVMAISAHQLPVARDYSPGMGRTALAVAAGAQDRVEISAEARRRAADEASEDVHLWGEVRYDYPHTDDPDLPHEVAHAEWVDLMAKVFGKPAEADSPAA